MTPLDRLLNQITMYRLVLYCLLAYIGIAMIFSYFKILPFTPLSLLVSSAVLISSSYISNKIFSKMLGIPTNVESFFITALILALILTPASNLSGLATLALIGVFASSSKYLLVVNKKHLFNPAAVAVVISALLLNTGASWWVGNQMMIIPVALGAVLIIRKNQILLPVFTFFAASLTFVLFTGLTQRIELPALFSSVLLDSPILFFATIMLSEPFTMPPARNNRAIYGALTGILMMSGARIGQVYFTPEIALVLANIFSFIVSPKDILVLTLKEKVKLAPDIFEFVFAPNKKFKYRAGQYLEFTLKEKSPDNRGNRRYFTLSSSPTEDELRIASKFYDRPSAFKKELVKLNKGSTVLGSRLSGEFTLKKNPETKYVFIGGGIGITPFSSIIKYMMDAGQKRDIVLFYSERNPREFVYQEIFDRANKVLGLKTIYTITEEKSFKNWKGSTGPISEQMIKESVPDFKQRYFYLSGPHSMVAAYEKLLKEMGVKQTHVVKDFFPGYA